MRSMLSEHEGVSEPETYSTETLVVCAVIAWLVVDDMRALENFVHLLPVLRAPGADPPRTERPARIARRRLSVSLEAQAVLRSLSSLPPPAGPVLLYKTSQAPTGPAQPK
jgi:hypothetical protein